MYICDSCKNVMEKKQKACACCGRGVPSEKRVVLTSPAKWFLGEVVYLLTAFFFCLLADSLLTQQGEGPRMMAAAFRLVAYILALLSVYFLVMVVLSMVFQVRLPRYSEEAFARVLKDGRTYQNRTLIRSRAMRYVSLGFLVLSILLLILTAFSAVDLAYAARYEKPLFPALHKLSAALFSLLLM